MTTPTTPAPAPPASRDPDLTPAPATEMTALGHVVARRCPECRGQGTIPNDAWMAAWDAANDLPDPDERQAALDAITTAGEPADWPCGECDAEGWAVTPAGRELLAFLRRFGGER